MKINFSIPETIRNNNEKTFEILFKKYYPALCLYSKRYIEDKNVREDIVQDVFVILWDKRTEIAFNDSALFYLKASVKNACINYLKHRGYEQLYTEDFIIHASLYDKEGEHVYLLHELEELLEKSLQKLPDEYKAVYVKSYLEEKSNIEIAESEGVSTKTIERYKKKILSQLKNDLKEYIQS